jgi:hypothetical protein
MILLHKNKQRVPHQEEVNSYDRRKQTSKRGTLIAIWIPLTMPVVYVNNGKAQEAKEVLVTIFNNLSTKHE